MVLLTINDNTYLKSLRARRHEELGLGAKNDLVDVAGVFLAFDGEIREFAGYKQPRKLT